MTANMTGIAPILLVHDIDANIAFWREKVGFEVEIYGDPASFAIASRGQARVMLQAVSAETQVTPNWKLAEKTSNLFIWVDDARAIHDELQARGAPIDWSLYHAPWGGLEFGIQDPQGHDIAIAQVLDGVEEEVK